MTALANLPDRTMSGSELEALVSSLALEPETWGRLVRHISEQRVFEQLVRDEHVDVWVLSWLHDHDTGYHDHDISGGAVSVVRGAVVEERLRVGGPPRRRRYEAGETFSFAASHVHRMFHDGTEPAVSIHAYSPPLWRLGAYVVEHDGTLRRESISYAEELRPLDAPAPAADLLLPV